MLGILVSTFAYSLLVLRIIRTPTGAAESFVPVISLTTAVSLALACVGFLIYFIHHIANLIQSSTVVQSAHRDSLRAINNLHDPEEPEVADEVGGDDVSFPSVEPVTLLSRRSGYVQHLELDAIASALGGLSGPGGSTTYADIPFGPGFFVSAGVPIARVWTGEMNGETEKRLHGGSCSARSALSSRTSHSGSGSFRT